MNHGLRAPTPVVLGIAHDLNGMLSTLLTGLNLLERSGMDSAVHRCTVEAYRQATTGDDSRGMIANFRLLAIV